MSSTADREGLAGTVTGPFLAQVDIDGWPKGRACAAFLRPTDRDLFLTVVRLRSALSNKTKNRTEIHELLEKIAP